MITMRTFLRLMACLLASIVLNACDRSEGALNVTLLAHVNDYRSVGYNDVWGYTGPDDREYALLGVKNGTSIVDITDVENPAEVAFIGSPHSDWQDIKTYLHYAYTVNETGGGLHIIDLQDLPNSASLVDTYTGFGASHNIYIDEANGILYAEGGGSKPVRVLSLADPESPEEIASFGVECHDIYVRDGRAYISEGNQGSVGIFDVTDPAEPAFLARIHFPLAGYVHNAWIDETNSYLISTEETRGKTVKLWDIRDFEDFSIADTYLAPNDLAHNAFIMGDLSFISHYESGLRIVDLSDPQQIEEVGFYDTRDAWGTYPYLASGKILISDINDGLYVVRYEPE